MQNKIPFFLVISTIEGFFSSNESINAFSFSSDVIFTDFDLSETAKKKVIDKILTRLLRIKFTYFFSFSVYKKEVHGSNSGWLRIQMFGDDSRL